eukprot:1030031-Pyramimonas_sp.AAC.1
MRATLKSLRPTPDFRYTQNKAILPKALVLKKHLQIRASCTTCSPGSPIQASKKARIRIKQPPDAPPSGPRTAAVPNTFQPLH